MVRFMNNYSVALLGLTHCWCFQTKEVLRTFEGRRVVNIYDLSEKCFLIKLVATGVAEKTFMLLESGVRFHQTKYTRSQPQAPSPFAMILRRYLRTKRLERVDQLGMDRVVDFKFGSGDSANHLILELYSSGNIVLTDCNYEVLALLRSHQFSDEIILKVGEIYPIACCTNIGALIASSAELTQIDSSVAFFDWLNGQANILAESKVAQQGIGSKLGKAKKSAQDSSKPVYLRQLLLGKSSCVSYLGPDILDHCILAAGLDINARIDQILSLESEKVYKFLEVLREAASSLLDSLDEKGPGYVIVVPPSSSNETEEQMVDFTPRLFRQHEEKKYVAFESFSEAVDEYYHRIEQQKALNDQRSRVLAAEKKLAKVQKDQQRVVDTLVQQQAYFQDCAMLLETHAEEVDKVRLVINSALGVEMSWPDVEAMVELEQKKGNPLAKRISRLSLDENKIFLRFDAKEVYQGFQSSDEEDNVVQQGIHSSLIRLYLLLMMLTD
jgi:predicted ribosome quality control (RQC) complex YloA/Tae2 family protein